MKTQTKLATQLREAPEIEQVITIEWMMGRGWSSSEAADFLGVSPSHLIRVIRGERTSMALLKKIQRLPQKRLVLRRASKLNLSELV